jgi:putative ATP-dependent endonuclease of OLD family
LTGEKPYTAVQTLQKDGDRRKVITELLTALVDHTAPLRVGPLEWAEMGDLEAAMVV